MDLNAYKEDVARLAVCGASSEAQVVLNVLRAYWDEQNAIKPGAAAPFVVACARAGRMNGLVDVPALYLAFLHEQKYSSFEEAFEAIATSTDVVLRFVHYVRRGPTTRRSIGNQGQRALNDWLVRQPLQSLLSTKARASGNVADVLALAHPRPDHRDRRLVYGYLCGRVLSEADLLHLRRTFRLPPRQHSEIPYAKTVLIPPQMSWVAFVTHAVENNATPC